VSFKPDQVRRPTPGAPVRGTVFDAPLPPLDVRPAGPARTSERVRDHYRRTRTRDTRPIWPETPGGWALLGGVSVVLAIVLVAILLMPGRSAPAVVVDGASSTPGPTLVAGTSASPSSGATPTANPASATNADVTPEPSRDPTIPPDTLTGYRWPLAAPILTNPFGPSVYGDFFYQGVRVHDGLDLASWCGDNVLAAHDGTVLATGTQFDDYMGWVESLQPYKDLFNRKHWWSSLPLTVVIDDGNGFRSIYAHEYKIVVKVGQKVKAGQLLGYEGATGNATGCHVHYGLFSPTETATFELDPGIVSRDLLPQHEVARVNPLYVLPFRCDIEEMRPLYPAKAATCPPPTPSPAPKK